MQLTEIQPLIEYQEAQKRVLGFGKNTITISDDFDQFPIELKEYFESPSI
ncbi:MAG TPA: hypothetical protein PLY23_02535 [Alphaproteobacteria bacterium]|nr:hypothetical protein [Alphaproteobacteria bacterium]HQS93597.1 hypothetical protein [Alphaproteobacteria bacterium]